MPTGHDELCPLRCPLRGAFGCPFWASPGCISKCAFRARAGASSCDAPFAMPWRWFCIASTAWESVAASRLYALSLLRRKQSRHCTVMMRAAIWRLVSSASSMILWRTSEPDTGDAVVAILIIECDRLMS
eukprot:4431261-Prymnesium_polylepis.1